MKIIGADLSTTGHGENTLVLLDETGRVAAVRHPPLLPAVAVEIGELAGGEPFLVGVDLPVVVPGRAARNRPVDSLVRRRLGHRIAPGGRGALGTGRAVTGEALLAALAAAGVPCLPYPDRDRRTSGLAEIHPGLVLKALLWESSPAARSSGQADRTELFRAYAMPEYRIRTGRSRSSWADRAVALDLALRVVVPAPGFDVRPAREGLASAASDQDVERAGSLLDACLLAGTARRYLDEPEACVFLGDREGGYTILPADGFVRRLALRESRAAPGRLFPRAPIRETLASVAEVRSVELLSVPGRPQRLEALFRTQPLYEFDNLDEMLWWKHCRHLAGPALPSEGLRDLVVSLGNEEAGGDERPTPLRLVRSRHRTLSFRFDPPRAWRTRVPTRDGKTYAFRVLRATYEALPSED